VKTTLEIRDDLTGLVGANGTGKSNILNAVLLLKKISNFSRHTFLGGRESLDNKSFLRAEIEYESKSVFLNAKISYENNEENKDELINVEMWWDFSKLLKVPSRIEIPIDIFRYQDFILDNRTSNAIENIVKFNKITLNSDQIGNINDIFPYMNNIIKSFSRISYYGASQFSDPSQCPNFIEMEDERLVRKYRLRDGHERFIVDLYQACKNKDKKGSKYDLYLNTVDKNGIGLLDDISFQEVPIASSSYKVLSGGKVKTFEKNRLLIIPNFIIDKSSLSPNQLSEGTFRTLSLIFYLLTDENDLLLIEEPEVCVHHGLLNSIISIIKSQSKKKQIIISTHSDFVLDQLEPENLILVNKTTKGTIAKSLTKSMTKNEYKSLKAYLEETGNLGDYWKETGFSK